MFKRLTVVVCVVALCGCDQISEAFKSSSKGGSTKTSSSAASGTSGGSGELLPGRTGSVRVEEVDNAMAQRFKGPGPHGGKVRPLGDGVHQVETVLEHAGETLTAYVLGSDGKTPATLEAKQMNIRYGGASKDFSGTLRAIPAEGDPEGESSVYSGAAGMLREALKRGDGAKLTVWHDGKEKTIGGL